MENTVKLFWFLQKRLLVMVALLLPLIGGVVPSSASVQAGERCFAETGQCISGPIRAYWERNGGLPIFGYPISPQRVELVEGLPFPIQWFERDRLEDHGAQGVLAGRLGARALELSYRPWEYFDKVAAGDVPAGCQFFAQTGHSLCQPYLGYWQANGGLERFGYPVTQPFYEDIGEDRFAAQYFERRRMEIHPELPGSPILLGLLGSQVLNAPEPAMSYPDCLQQAPPSLLPAIAKLRLGEPIGCPAGASWIALPASTQQFERGIMIWLSQRSTYPLAHGYPPTIFALSDPGPAVRDYSDTWVDGQDPDTPAFTPPGPGLYAPWRGFGKVWSIYPDLREAIGWATEPQAQARTVDTQLFSGALLVRINETGVVYAFGNANNSPYAQVVVP
jgi:hypothetical protein